MDDEILTPLPSTTSEPFSQRWGLSADYTLHVPISTSISEPGIGHTPGLNLHIAEDFNKRFQLRLQFPFSSTEVKLLPTTTSEGTTAEHTHWGFQIGFGRFSRSFPHFGEEGDFTAALDVGVTPMIGRGSSTITQKDRALGGETFKFNGESAGTWDIGTRYTFTGSFRPAGGRGPVLGIGPGFYYGLQYEKEGSAFNRVRLDLMLMAEIGYGDGSTIAGGGADAETGAMGITWGMYQLGHSYAQRYMFNKTLLRPKEVLDEYGLGGTSGTDRGSQADIPMLQGAALAFAGIGNKPTVDLHAGQGWFWGFAALRTVGGGAFVAADSVEARAGGVADILGVARLVQYPMWGIEEPEKRLSLSTEDVQKREAYINLIAFGLNTALTLIGAAAGSDTIEKGGAAANASIGFSPNPTERPTKRTDVSYVPYSVYYGKDISGNRAGLVVHNDFNSVPLYASAFFFSPMLIPGNVGNMPSQGQPYSSVMLPTTVGASAGLSWTTTFTRLYGGPLTTANFGSDQQKVGVGGIAGFFVLLPFNGKENGSGISLGVSGTAVKSFPKGAEFELLPSAGITLGN